MQPHPLNHNQVLFALVRLAAGWDAARFSTSFLGASTFALAAGARFANAPPAQDLTSFFMKGSYELPAVLLTGFNVLMLAASYQKRGQRTTLN